MGLPRYHIEGHIYYITTVTYGRLPIFTRPSFIIPLIDSLNFYRCKRQFKLVGYVIMPDHIHLMIWPYGESTPTEIMRDFKKFTAVRIIRQAEVEGNADWLAAFQQSGRRDGTKPEQGLAGQLLGQEHLLQSHPAPETRLHPS